MTFSHRFDPDILREYDIRGIVGGSLHAADAFALGRGFGALAGGNKVVVVGFDGRLSSPALEAALVEGLTAGGAEVLRVGRGPTPLLYYAATMHKADGAVMVTGSHNPPDYNGFKLMRAGKPFYGAAIQALARRLEAGEAAPASLGSVRDIDVATDYVARLLADFRGGERQLRVVWDNGNGAAGEVLARLLARLPGQHWIINGEIDGRFPAHHPDPTIPANLRQLIAEVQARGADLGIAFDGDADRIGAVDNNGTILFGDQLLALLARDVLAAHPGSVVIGDIKASQMLFDEITRLGGKPLMWKTGHSLIKAKMAETAAKLAGEMSGHIFFADHWYGFDDALYAALRLLDTVAPMSAPLSAALAALPAMINTPELRIDCAEARKFAVIDEVAARLAAAGADVVAIDGVRVSTGDGWWLLRASNTQPVLVARAESASAAGLERLQAALAGQLQASGVAVPDFSGATIGHA